MINRPNAPEVTATEWVRALSKGENGGSEPHVFRCNDGRMYMVKASNNPQGGRVLVNEVVGCLALDWLGVNHPKTAIVNLSKPLLDATPSAKFNNGKKIEPGLSFGSEYITSEPDGTVPIMDLINISDIAGTLVFDTWFKPHDRRQYRIRLNQMGQNEFMPLDQGHSLAPNWTAGNLDSIAVDGQVCLAVELCPLTAGDVRPFIERLSTFDQSAAEHIVSQVPVTWLSADDEKKALTKCLTARALFASEKLHEKYPTT